MINTKILVACTFFLSAPALAQSPFDGTWKMDPSKAKWSDKPSEVLLSDGLYSCQSCTPAYKIKADGTYQRRVGAGVDESSVQVLNDRMAKLAWRKSGQLLGEALVTVSADGTTRTVEGMEYAPNGIVTRYTTTQRRVGPIPAGAHMSSGKWVMDRLNNASDEQMLVTFKADGDKLSMTTPDGYSYAARFGGEPVAVGGDRTGGTVQIRRLSDSSFEETNRRDGKVTSVNTFARVADDRMMLRTENKMNGAVDEFELVRQ